jgi:hypothetical protein
MTMKIKAVATEAPNAIVAQAIDKQLRAMSRILASAGVELGSIGKVSARALSTKLKAAGVAPEQRIAAKIALGRAGLLVD